MKAKRAALEQKLKFSDKTEEQQKIPNKLRLQQATQNFSRAGRIWRGLKRAKSVRLWRNRSIAQRNGKEDWSVCKPLRISSHSSDVERKFVVASKWKQRVTSHTLYWHRTPTFHGTLSLHDPHWHRTPNGLLPRQRTSSNLPSYNRHGTRGSLPCRHTRSSKIRINISIWATAHLPLP